MNYGLITGAVAALASMASTSLASATTMTETFSATTGSTVTDFTLPLTVSGFNSSLGTLTGVAVTLSTAGTFNGNVTNTAGTAESFSVAEEVDISATASDALLSSLTSSLTASQSYSNLATNATSAFGPYSPTMSSSGVATSAEFADFIGKSVTATINTLTSTTVKGGGGNIKNNISTFADATLTVVYTYTAASTSVPEPGTMAVLGLGLLGLGLVRQVKFNKSV